MKNFLIALILTVSFATNASVTSEVTIENPVYPGTNIKFAFVAWSCTVQGEGCPSGQTFTPVRKKFYGADFYLNENGVCKALGYKTAKPNSSYSDEGSNGDRRLQVNNNGRVIGATAGRTLNGITCIDQIADFQPEELANILNPMHPTTGLPFSQSDSENYPYEYGNPAESASDVNAVCVVLGYTRGIIQSAQVGNNVGIPSGNATQVRNDGTEQLQNQVLIMPHIMCAR